MQLPPRWSRAHDSTKAAGPPLPQIRGENRAIGLARERRGASAEEPTPQSAGGSWSSLGISRRIPNLQSRLAFGNFRIMRVKANVLRIHDLVDGAQAQPELPLRAPIGNGRGDVERHQIARR